MQHVTLTQEQLDTLLAKAIASSPVGASSVDNSKLEEIVSSGIQKAFLIIGIGSDNPLEMQQDFAFLRSMRTGVEAMKSRTVQLMLGSILTGLGTIVWLGYKAFTSGSK